MNTREIFKKNLNQFIIQSGKSKKTISEEMGIPYSTLAEWANGNKFPRADGIEKLANYFNILKSDLLEDNVDTITYTPFKKDDKKNQLVNQLLKIVQTYDIHQLDALVSIAKHIPGNAISVQLTPIERKK